MNLGAFRLFSFLPSFPWGSALSAPWHFPIYHLFWYTFSFFGKFPNLVNSKDGILIGKRGGLRGKGKEDEEEDKEEDEER